MKKATTTMKKRKSGIEEGRLPRRTMRLHHTYIALPLIAALFACTARQDESPDAGPVQEPAPAEVADPMASFARMVSGEWQAASTKPCYRENMLN